MRCWIMSSKRWGDTADERWLVEWQVKHPEYDTMSTDERDDFDPGCHPTRRREFKVNERDAAVAFARTVLAESFFGVVDVTKQSLEHVDRDVYDWEDGEIIYVDSDDPADSIAVRGR